MGNRSSSSAASTRQNGNDDTGMSLFDIASLVIHDRMPITPMNVPTCLDELVDWTEEATLTAIRLADVNVLSPDTTISRPVCFIPLVKTGVCRLKAVTQRDVTRFPADCTFERTAFYHQDTLVCIQAMDLYDEATCPVPSKDGTYYTLSGLNFCIYVKLLRRLSQLKELNNDDSTSSVESSDDYYDTDIHEKDECGICMARPQETVLPCLHGVCSSCEQKWVETHYDCPFCRTQYTNTRRRHRNQWQLENWSREDAEQDIADLLQQIQTFWKQHGTTRTAGRMQQFTRLETSLHESLVDDDFVLLD